MRRAALMGLLTTILALPLGGAQESTEAPDFTRAATEARKFQLAPGLRLTPWAAEPQLRNPVAFSLTPAPAPPGPPNPAALPVTAWIAETHRYGVSVLDITQNTPWLLNDLSLRSVPERTDFLTARFGTNAALLTRDSERIRRVTDSDGDRRADRAETFAEGFQSVADGTAAGILALGTNLWFGNVPNLWRLSAPPASAIASPDPASAASQPTRDLLASGFGVHIGVTGHDLHGLVFGPDGRLYASFGDRGLHVTNREGAVLHAPDTGGVIRCEPDGSHLELFCTGLRNPQELAFDHQGNLFTVDNDTAGADDCRVLHLVEGTDYGWRSSYQHMKGFGPWVREGLWRGGLDGIPPPAGKVSQGPAGLTFHPGGGALGGRFASSFLHCDFPGGVWAFALETRGASFTVGGREKVLWNCWPTDVEFGPDGALYVLDWVSGWGLGQRGRIHRIATEADPLGTSDERGVYRLLRDGFHDRPIPSLLSWLGHADYRVRCAAADALALTGRAALAPILDLARRAGDPVIRRHALWIADRLVRGLPPEDPDVAATRSVAAQLADHPVVDTRVQALRLLREYGRPTDSRTILSRIEDPSGAVRAAALQAAARCQVPLPDALWERSWDPFELVALSASQASRSAPLTRAVLLSQRRRRSPALAVFLASTSAPLMLEAARAIHDLPIPEALPALAGLLSDPTLLAPSSPPASAPGTDPTNTPTLPPREQLLARALNAQYRLGQPHHASNLVAFASGRTPEDTPALWPPSLRAEALFLLARWAVAPAEPGRVPVFPSADPNHGAVPSVNPENWPGWFDRITGLWRPLPPRSADAARAALAPRINALIQDPELPVALAAVQAAVDLGLTHAGPRLAARLLDPTSPPELRRRLPGALATLGSDLLPVALQTALEDPDPELQTAAIPWLGRLQGKEGTHLLITKLGEALASRPITPAALRLGQAALDALGSAPAAEAEPALIDALRRLIDGALEPGLELNLLEAARRQNTPALAPLLAHRDASIPTADPVAAWRDALTGGDAERGRALFVEKVETQCARCHRIGSEGGTVGPPLDGVGTLRSRHYLLESILFPSRQLAPGYETVLVTLHNGQELAGIVRAEDEQTVTLTGTEEGDLRLDKMNIRTRTRGLSAMPEGLREFLTRRELRDLVEYLASLRTKPPH